MGGRVWMPIGGWYHATKHAAEVVSDALRVETKPYGIRVVVVQPGAIESEWAGIAAKTLQESSIDGAYAEQVAPMAKLMADYKNAASPDVIAKAVSRAVNGARPCRRYATPLDAKLLAFLHWLLPDWAWERFLSVAVK